MLLWSVSDFVADAKNPSVYVLIRIIIILYITAYHILPVINPMISTSATLIIPDIINSIPYAHTSFSSSVIGLLLLLGVRKEGRFHEEDS